MTELELTSETTVETLSTIEASLTPQSELISEDVDQTEELTTLEAATDVVEEAVEEVQEIESTPYSLDIDFENYTVPAKRAQYIRNQIQALKEKSWLNDAIDWVHATGEDFNTDTEGGDLLAENMAKRIRLSQDFEKEVAAEGEAEASLTHQMELILDGSDLEIKINGLKFLHCQKLPKGEELLVSHYNPEHLSIFTKMEALLHSHVKAFLKGKAEKNKLLQEKLAAKAAKLMSFSDPAPETKS